MALPNKNRLTGKKDFEQILREGVAVKGRSLFIKYKKNKSSVFRFGSVVSLIVARNAVARNRIKRVFSEIVRQYVREGVKNLIGLDIVAIVSRRDDEEVLIKELGVLLGKLN